MLNHCWHYEDNLLIPIKQTKTFCCWCLKTLLLNDDVFPPIRGCSNYYNPELVTNYLEENNTEFVKYIENNDNHAIIFYNKKKCIVNRGFSSFRYHICDKHSIIIEWNVESRFVVHGFDQEVFAKLEWID